MQKSANTLVEKLFGEGEYQEKSITIRLNRELSLEIKHCIIGACSEIDDQEIIMLLPGPNSNWTGMARLAYEFAAIGFEVCIPSMPGCGNSSNADSLYYQPNKKFQEFADVLASFTKKVFPHKKIHFVGHSMGAAVIAALTFKHSDLIKSLVFLNPTGFRKRGIFEFLFKLTLNGLLHGYYFKNDPIQAEITQHLPKQKSSFSINRLGQRVNELIMICRGCAYGYLDEIDSISFPKAYITSEFDFVEPENTWIFKLENFFHQNISGSFHNTTQFRSKDTANCIVTFFDSFKSRP